MRASAAQGTRLGEGRGRRATRRRRGSCHWGSSGSASARATWMTLASPRGIWSGCTRGWPPRACRSGVHAATVRARGRVHVSMARDSGRSSGGSQSRQGRPRPRRRREWPEDLSSRRTSRGDAATGPPPARPTISFNSAGLFRPRRIDWPQVCGNGAVQDRGECPHGRAQDLGLRLSGACMRTGAPARDPTNRMCRTHLPTPIAGSGAVWRTDPTVVRCGGRINGWCA
jgi:hypothetical protein